MSSALQTIHGAPSWVLNTPGVTLAVTRQGGHMAPVRFKLGTRWVGPYSLPPWTADTHAEFTPVERTLRGDFFCFPFGAEKNSKAPHGDSANAVWELAELNGSRLQLHLASENPEAEIKKTITLKGAHTALYIEHRISGASGTLGYGHHPILQLPPRPCPVTTAPFESAHVWPGDLEDPVLGQHSRLRPGAMIDDLENLPCRDGSTTSLSDYNSLEGCEEMLLVAHKPGLRWNAVVLDGYVWFALKRTEDFPATLFWVSNGGRAFVPWASRHRRRLGVEDVCVHPGDPASGAKDRPGKKPDFKTAHSFSPNRSVVLRHIQGVAPLPEKPADSPKVERIVFGREGNGIEIEFDKGQSVSAAVDWEFLDQ